MKDATIIAMGLGLVWALVTVASNPNTDDTRSARATVVALKTQVAEMRRPTVTPVPSFNYCMYAPSYPGCSKQP